jgi:hypothetical protein
MQFNELRIECTLNSISIQRKKDVIKLSVANACFHCFRILKKMKKVFF